MLTSRRLPLPLLLFFCSITVAGQSSAQYTITELGNFSPRAVNNSATVVGSMGNKAVLFRNGVLTDANWFRCDFPINSTAPEKSGSKSRSVGKRVIPAASSSLQVLDQSPGPLTIVPGGPATFGA